MNNKNLIDPISVTNMCNNTGRISIGDSFLEYSLYTFINDDAYIEKSSHFPLYIQDIIYHIPCKGNKLIISIDFIFVPNHNRNKGVGSDLINKVVEIYPNAIICLNASPTKYDFDSPPTKEEYDEFFNNINKFYESLNFKSYNNITQYEQSDPYIWIGNNIGDLIYKNMIK